MAALDRLRDRLRVYRRDTRGGIAIMACAFFMVAIMAAALAIDVGGLYLEKRRAQGITDLAAMAAASDLAHAVAAARATLAANHVDLSEVDVEVEVGHYEGEIATAVGQRFVPGVQPYNAARVTLTQPTRTVFAQVFSDERFTVRVAGLATNAQLATFSLGSRLAALREGVVNQLLGGLLGSNVTLTAADYSALVNADVGLFQFSRALAHEVNLSAGTYEDLMAAQVTSSQIIRALSASVPGVSARAALTKLASQTSSSERFPVAAVVNFGPLENVAIGSAPAGAEPQMNGMALLTAAAGVANGGRQVRLDLGATIPGIASLKLDLAIGEPMQHSSWAAVGQAGAQVETAQIRVRLVAEIGGTGLLAGTRVRLPIYLDGATATGRLAAITCAPDGRGTVTVAAKPGIASAHIGEVSDWDLTSFHSHVTTSKATLVDLMLIKVKGQAHVDVTNTSATQLTFTQTDIDHKVIKRASTRNITETLVGSLLGNLSLSLGPLTVPAVDPLVRGILSNATAPLDQVLYTVLTTLGVRLGEVDVQVNGVRCGGSVLAG